MAGGGGGGVVVGKQLQLPVQDTDGGSVGLIWCNKCVHFRSKECVCVCVITQVGGGLWVEGFISGVAIPPKRTETHATQATWREASQRRSTEPGRDPVTAVPSPRQETHRGRFHNEAALKSPRLCVSAGRISCRGNSLLV